ncbi:Aste57867_160 [Aphanomyces stellatus]|uniref:Aste57867_160 protein n=1 Tax=Aphanomyces stellatus TaxID=120398 RepID=A0A485K6V8_9STRA|nr:hypothetical protein As57867_000160 [Aphanomyces stellatus]VFT77386.1 Aste57867_160 [Aphanomyces stellatus]
MDRHAVKRVRCRKCRHEQEPQKHCGKCNFEFGKYFCKVCNLFDHKGDEKGIFHCEKCGICRVGGRDKYFHCEKCSGCYPTAGRDKHKCINGAMLQECCICFEDMFHSRESPMVLRCGHVLHMTCWRTMLQYSRFECPWCRDSLLPSGDEGEVEEGEDEEGEDGEGTDEDDMDEDEEMNEALQELVDELENDDDMDEAVDELVDFVVVEHGDFEGDEGN